MAPKDSASLSTAASSTQGSWRNMTRNEKCSLDDGQLSDTADLVREHLEKFDGKSNLCQLRDGAGSILELEPADLEVGRLIGSGSFNDVYEATVAEHACGNIGGKKRAFVLKHLTSDIMNDVDKHTTGMVDLVLEARILTGLDHVNICRIEGVPAGKVTDVIQSGIVGSYFLLLERVECTLHEKVHFDWSRTQDNKLKKRALSMLSKESTCFPKIRFHVAEQIARGLDYLHSKNIIYRDVKPANIGMDFEGRAKIFDFGLAKEVTNPKRKNTGLCGTRRYMAPEVGRCRMYGLSCDVYSISILFWEMLALERPFAKLAAKDFGETVYFGTERPVIPKKWPEEIKTLLPQCWKVDQDTRPSMKEFADAMAEFAKAAPEDDKDD